MNDQRAMLAVLIAVPILLVLRHVGVTLADWLLELWWDRRNCS